MTEEALEHIIDVTGPNEGVDREQAPSLLVDQGFSEEDATWVIQELIDRGYCYVVDGELFVTDRDVLD